MSNMSITVPVLRDATSYALEAIEKSRETNGETVFVIVSDSSARYGICEALWVHSHTNDIFRPDRKLYAGRAEGRDWKVIVLADGL